MYPLERQQQILKILYESNRIDVSSLSQTLAVSGVTIRKDLERLENDGLLLRTHGGAILPEAQATPLPANPDNQDLSSHLGQIGLTAAELVPDNSSVFIGTGRVCLEIALNLVNKNNINIVTNNLHIVMNMPSTNGIRMLLTGGERRESEGIMFLAGSRTSEFLSDIYVDRAIITVDGISLDRGYTISNYDDERIYSNIIHNSKELIVAADSAKFDNISFSKIADIDMPCKVVSDVQTPKKYLEYYFMNNIPIYTSYELEGRIGK
jgi:DeoR/GlpR family transcriptional regulator of sugar metabolism